MRIGSRQYGSTNVISPKTTRGRFFKPETNRGRYGLPSLVFTRLQQQQQDANAAASNTTTSSTDKGKEGGRDEQATMDLDRVAINHLSLVLLPLALGLAARCVFGRW